VFKWAKQLLSVPSTVIGTKKFPKLHDSAVKYELDQKVCALYIL